MTITNKSLPLNTTYRINNTPISKVTHTKYLGVTLCQNLSWSRHIDNITSEANSIRALLQRNFRQCSQHLKSLAYFTYVRPILEYASVVWSLHIKSNKDKLEMAQKNATGFTYNDYYRYSSVSNMLHQLNWKTLEQRRAKATTIMFYKIINDIVSVNFSNYLQRSTTKTRGHQLKFLNISARINTFYNSFLPTARILYLYLT